jgi:hypothetical protein
MGYGRHYSLANRFVGQKVLTQTFLKRVHKGKVGV